MTTPGHIQLYQRLNHLEGETAVRAVLCRATSWDIHQLVEFGRDGLRLWIWNLVVAEDRRRAAGATHTSEETAS